MNINPFIILAIIGTVVSVIWAGVSSVVYNATGVNIPFLSFIPKFPIDFSKATLPQPTQNNQTTLPTYDWGNWLHSIPISAVVDYISGGTGKIIDFLSSPMQYLFTILVRLFCSDCVLPNYFGFLVMILLIILFAWFAWEQLWELGHRISLIVLIIVILVVMIVVVLSLLGVLQ